MRNDLLHEEDEEDCENDLIDSDDEEDVLHIPSERLSAHQRDRREHRQAMDLARNGTRSKRQPTKFACGGNCCSIRQKPAPQTPSEINTTAHRLREARLDELLGCDTRTVLRALGVLDAVEGHILLVTMDDDDIEGDPVLNVKD